MMPSRSVSSLRSVPLDAPPVFASCELVRESRVLRLSAAGLVAILILFALAMLLVPWQQTAYGSGQVMAYAPMERQQTIEAPVDGRIVRWWIQEGSYVEKGARLLEIADNDPQILERLRRELDAASAQQQAKRVGLEAYASQVKALEGALKVELLAARARARMAENVVKAAQQGVLAAQAALRTAELNYDRQKLLVSKGLSSRRDLEIAELTFTKAQTEAFAAEAKLQTARGDAEARTAEIEAKRADFEAKIAKVQAARQATEADLAKARAGAAQVENRLARQRQMLITAPRAGTVVRMIAREGAEFVKSGDPLIVFVPSDAKRAVEIWIDGNDAPLIRPGRNVRLQFEGWPAFQFSGWPSVAVGTFGGVVAFVDASADPGGRFRVVILPDQEGWPEDRYLRQGARANAWLLLDRVSLGYEVWRQINGFPPTVSDVAPTPPKKSEKK